MRIERIEVYRIELPFAGDAYRLSGGRTYTSFDATLVHLHTACGLDGWGESTPFGSTYVAAHAEGVRAGLNEIAPSVLGLDPRHVERVNDAMDAVLVGHRHAKTPIDVACWDLFGKSVEMPTCDLLGGRIPGPVPLISSIHAGEPETMRTRVAEIRRRGFVGHSIKIGADDAEGGPALDAARICECLADRRPGEWFLADANGGLSVEHAVRMIEQLPPGLDIVLEAPCRTWRETMSLRRRSRIPILLDELAESDADIAQIIAQDAADGVGIKISKQGGLTASRRQRDLCLAAGLVVSVQDTVGSEIAFAALLHLAQCTPRQWLRCALDTRSMVSRSTATFDAPIVNGGAECPRLPGLGLTVDDVALGTPVAVFER